MYADRRQYIDVNLHLFDPWPSVFTDVNYIQIRPQISDLSGCLTCKDMQHSSSLNTCLDDRYCREIIKRLKLQGRNFNVELTKKT